jgi:hypothetical protein
VYVAAAILREEHTGNLQKLLADGLAYAPTLERADLQRTNLQNAYFGERKPVGRPRVTVTPKLMGADFYRANLAQASLKGADVRSAQFYQARMHGTVLTRADLRGANFFQADLLGAKWNGAKLHGANFDGATNLPKYIADKLDHQRNYSDPTPVTVASAGAANDELRVFLSKPNCLTAKQRQYVEALQMQLGREQVAVYSLERDDYPKSGALGEVQRLMHTCHGAVVLLFEQLEVRDGVWRPSTAEEKLLKEAWLPTAWSHIELGMAAAWGMPTLVLQPRRAGNLFPFPGDEPYLHLAFIDDTWDTSALGSAFAAWFTELRERRADGALL